MKYLKRFNESNQSDVISQEFDDIFGEYNVSLSYQEGGFLGPDKIACYICSDEYIRVSDWAAANSNISIADVEELVLHFISFMISEMDTKLISLGIKPFDKHFKTRLKNFYNEEPNRWGVYHPYYKGGNLNDLFDIQDFDKNKPFDLIELKFKKL